MKSSKLRFIGLLLCLIMASTGVGCGSDSSFQDYLTNILNLPEDYFMDSAKSAIPGLGEIEAIRNYKEPNFWSRLGYSIVTDVTKKAGYFFDRLVSPIRTDPDP